MSECKYNPETCDIYKEFNDDIIKAQAERIEKLEKLVKAVDYCPKLCGIELDFIDGKNWFEYRDEVLK